MLRKQQYSNMTIRLDLWSKSTFTTVKVLSSCKYVLQFLGPQGRTRSQKNYKVTWILRKEQYLNMTVRLD